jgi:hypothetical protein
MSIERVKVCQIKLIPCYVCCDMLEHRKSNHIFIVWQHIVLLVMRQYEGKSYRLLDGRLNLIQSHLIPNLSAYSIIGDARVRREELSIIRWSS